MKHDCKVTALFFFFSNITDLKEPDMCSLSLGSNKLITICNQCSMHVKSTFETVLRTVKHRFSYS